MMSRRKAVKTLGVAAVGSVLTGSVAADFQVNNLAQILIGVITNADDPDKALKEVRNMGFSTCQISVRKYTIELAVKVREAFIKYKLKPNTLLCLGPGKMVWDFVEGPSTIGLIPVKFRKERISRLKEAIDFCKEAGIPAVHSHFGFIPENPGDPVYAEFISLMKDLGKYALEKKTDIYFETGQETPTTLQRTIEDIGTGNLFVNYDTANMVLYGKSNPLDGLKILAKYVRSLHVKDGMYPVDPMKLGEEKPIPEGIVDFPAVIAYLKEINFKGELIIENEMSDRTSDYIVKTRKYFENLISSK